MKYMIDVFSELGERLKLSLLDIGNEGFVEAAIEDNSWFTVSSIEYAIDAIVENYLQRDKITSWLDRYEAVGSPAVKSVAVIMAGNIPMVGFFDLMFVLISGHKCLYKLSSKDRVLMGYIISVLKDIDPNILLDELSDRDNVDAVIATGGDNAMRILRDRYRDIPAIYRGSRVSIAVLNGQETEQELELFANDVFMHSGLGCRNVSMIFIPENYALDQLLSLFSRYKTVSAKYRNNYVQNRAMMMLDGLDFIDGWFFTMTDEYQPSYIISNINTVNYVDMSEVDKWIHHHKDEIQCVVSSIDSLPFRVDIGRAQMPLLWEYPDRVDPFMELLNWTIKRDCELEININS